MKFSKEYRLILETITQIVPLLADLFIQVLLLVLFYAVYGVHLYGGLITDKTPKVYEEMIGDDMGKNYQYLSFNDIPNGILFLYSIMITNDWSKLSTQAMVTFEKPIEVFCARLFFLSFFCLGFILVLNTTIGTIIDFINTYLSILQDENEKEEEEEAGTNMMNLGNNLFGVLDSPNKKKNKKNQEKNKEKLKALAKGVLNPITSQRKRAEQSIAKHIFTDE